MAQINSVGAQQVASTGDGNQVTRSTGGSLDKDGFMKLLVAQLKQQDPMNAQGTDQMMAQMTQLSMLEQVQNLTKANEQLNANQTTSQALSLVGRDVTYTSSQGQTVSGKVEGVEFVKGVAQLTVGGQPGITMSQVTKAS